MKQITLGILTLSLIFLFSCEKETLDDKFLTQQVNAVQNAYEDDALKPNESTYDGEKIETDASDELKRELAESIISSFNKEDVYLKSGSLAYVGVFKWNTCGNMRELNIGMDCEDDKNSISKITGYGGASYVTSNDNVNLVFCIAANAYFERTDQTYGVLNLSSSVPYGVTRVLRVHDNENDNNKNDVRINNVYQDMPFGMGGITIGRESERMGGFSRMEWLIYKKKPSGSGTYPGLGVNTYGTLGTFCPKDGEICIDDEDTGNNNLCYIQEFDDNTGRYLPLRKSKKDENLFGVMRVDRNTRYYVTF